MPLDAWRKRPYGEIPEYVAEKPTATLSEDLVDVIQCRAAGTDIEHSLAADDPDALGRAAVVVTESAVDRERSVQVLTCDVPFAQEALVMRSSNVSVRIFFIKFRSKTDKGSGFVFVGSVGRFPRPT